MKSIIRVQKHTSRYTVIDNTGLNDPRLGLKARGLLGHLLTKPDNWEITVAGIVASCPDGKDSVQSALKELERFGYAEYRTVRGDGGRLGGKKWVIFESPSTQNVDQQLFVEDSSSHRQPGFPIIGKTDYRKNRLSGNPQQVSTVKEVSTDAQVSTVLRTSADKKNGFHSKEKNVDQSPPNSAAPPLVAQLFAHSEFFGNTTAWFKALSASCGVSVEQSEHYYNRCLSWSFEKNSKSRSWIDVAVRMFQQDSERQIKNFSNGASNSTDNALGVDTIRATKRAARFAERNGLTIGPFDGTR